MFFAKTHVFVEFVLEKTVKNYKFWLDFCLDKIDFYVLDIVELF